MEKNPLRVKRKIIGTITTGKVSIFKGNRTHAALGSYYDTGNKYINLLGF